MPGSGLGGMVFLSGRIFFRGPLPRFNVEKQARRTSKRGAQAKVHNLPFETDKKKECLRRTLQDEAGEPEFLDEGSQEPGSGEDSQIKEHMQDIAQG